jgi:hypothetical protein
MSSVGFTNLLDVIVLARRLMRRLAVPSELVT